MRIWKQHARQYLGRRRYLDQEEVVPLSYDRWASDRDYRRDLAGAGRDGVREGERPGSTRREHPNQ